MSCKLLHLCSYWGMPNNALVFLGEQISTVPSRVSASPWNIDLTPFYLAPSPILDLSDLPFMINPTQNFGELASPLEMYPGSKKKKNKTIISNYEMRTYLKIEI